MKLAILAGIDPAYADPTGKCGYYTNSRGQEVPRPCGSWRGGEPKPAEATAKCQDGTWSWSKHPNDPRTCSYHGGKVQ
jgi:hypothetical protein